MSYQQGRMSIFVRSVNFILDHQLVASMCCSVIKSFVVRESLLTSCLGALYPTSNAASEISLVPFSFVP